MVKTSSSDRKLLLFFIITAIIFKILTFFYSVIDIDESTYLLIGKEIFDGKLLYVDYYDTKPIGIFLIFGFVDLITGNGIIFTRLIAAILVGLTAFLLYRIKLKTSQNKYASVFAGLAYLILASMYRLTYAANTEIFFIFFTVLSFYIFFCWKKQSRFFIGALVAGTGFIIKYLVAFDLLAYGLFLVYLVFLGKMKIAKLFQAGVLMLAGFIIPVGIVMISYILLSHFEEFQRFSFSFLINYQDTNAMKNYLDFILDIHLKYLPAFIFFYYLLFINVLKLKRKPVSFFKITWFVMAVLAVVSLKKSNTHYFIQTFPAIAFILSDIFVLPNRAGVYIKKHSTVFFTGLMLILLIISLVNQSYYIFRRDIPREVAGYVEEKLDDGEIVYVPGYKQIIYYFLDQSPPTPYVHPTMFVYDYHIKGLNINTHKEVGKVLAKEPRFIIFCIESYMHGHEEYFNKNYKEVKVFDEDVFVYERRLKEF